MPASPEVVHLTSNAGRTDLGVVLARGMRGVRLAVPSTTPKRRQTRIVSTIGSKELATRSQLGACRRHQPGRRHDSFLDRQYSDAANYTIFDSWYLHVYQQVIDSKRLTRIVKKISPKRYTKEIRKFRRAGDDGKPLILSMFGKSEARPLSCLPESGFSVLQPRGRASSLADYTVSPANITCRQKVGGSAVHGRERGGVCA